MAELKNGFNTSANVKSNEMTKGELFAKTLLEKEGVKLVQLSENMVAIIDPKTNRLNVVDLAFNGKVANKPGFESIDVKIKAPVTKVNTQENIKGNELNR